MNIEIKNLDNLTADEKKTLEKLVEKANRKFKVFKPTCGQEYYLLTSDGFICSDVGNNHDHLDDTRFQLGNCFETKEQAEFAFEKQKVYTQLKRYALEHNEDVFDWRDGYQRKYYIYCECEKLGISYTEYLRVPSNIYFTSEEIAKNAIDEIGEEKIKKYLFEVDNEKFKSVLT